MIRNIAIAFVLLSIAVPVVMVFITAPWPMSTKVATALWLATFTAVGTWLSVRS